ncbi:mitochondrial protein Pet127-domain-containing protein [Multifurca ochricompacta]|uniref:Mitochondrial protein Pet127-domain-containing protein n=1 Tax=Multifurca ochricompacta TaxID=376703 RepID=A0AAD4M6V9_9AGAM|nr:mitochondrial protein Pet127-domain-containing protein [Multifurca ochricompacta]
MHPHSPPKPNTAKAKVKSPSPWHSQPKNKSLKGKKAKIDKRNEGNGNSEGFHDPPTKLSSRLQLRNASTRHLRGVKATEGIFTKHGVYSDFNKMLSVSDGDRENAPHLPNSLLYERRVDGVIQPRGFVNTILEDVIPPSPQSPVATLAHGLERVLFNPGVQWLQDPRSQVYTFTTWLENIIPVTNFAFERLPSFLPSSHDQDLYFVAQREGRKYAGSTSSMSGLLSQLYYLISGDKPGTLLEKFLTHSPSEFLRLTRSSDNPTVVMKEPKREAYRYAKSDKFVLRSQLDCFDGRLPGTGVFDIKTRAVMTIRHDLLNFEENSGYQIRTLHGLVESFEKEYYDLIRSAFLKYSFQARIGNMDGVFVAYHNTKRIFGFQYIPLAEMDARLFGESAVGDAVFEKCLLLLEVVLEEATRELPHQSIRLTAEKLEGEENLKVFLEPADWDEGAHGSRPVIQLDISTKSYIGEMATNGSSAVERSNLPWTVLWSISKSALDPRIIRGNLAAARQRAFHPLFLPTGVGIREMEKVWRELQFNPAAPVDVPFKADLFRPPPKSVQVLRRLARNGRNYLERTSQNGKEVAPLVAQAHRVGKSVLDLVEGNTTTLAHESQVLSGVQDPVELSENAMVNAISGDRDTAHRDMTSPIMEIQTTSPANVDTDLDPTRMTDQACRVPPVIPPATSLALEAQIGRTEFISETTLTHLEEMLSEDQRKMGREDAASLFN